MENSNNKKFRCAVLNKNEIIKHKGCYFFLRRLRDIIFSLTALILLSPIMLIITLVVFIDSPKANPIFVQERVGLNGKVFKLYKFRSMIPDAEKKLDELLAFNEMEGNAFKIKNDPRITKVGRFLRMTSLDELPQLVNIIKGDMSLVGPRPPLPREVAEYDEYELQRLYVTPGLTCYWQILPDRNDIPFDKWVDLDIKYIKERSMKTDFIIIFKTFSAVFGMNGV